MRNGVGRADRYVGIAMEGVPPGESGPAVSGHAQLYSVMVRRPPPPG